MRFCGKKTKVLRIMVIDGDVNVRQVLIDRFYESIKPKMHGYDEEIIRRISNVTQAIKEISGSRVRLNPDVIIISVDFPEIEIEKLRGYLCDNELSICIATLNPAEQAA